MAEGDRKGQVEGVRETKMGGRRKKERDEIKTVNLFQAWSEEQYGNNIKITGTN